MADAVEGIPSLTGVAGVDLLTLKSGTLVVDNARAPLSRR
jgi:hypothetical protein